MNDEKNKRGEQTNLFGEGKVLPHTPWSPFDPGVIRYLFIDRLAQVYMFSGWLEENMSWKESCYIFAGLNNTPTGFVTGPDAIKLLSDCTTNSHAHFPIGRIKHVCCTNNEGQIIMHGLTLRIEENKVWLTTIYPWVKCAAMMAGHYDVQFEDTQKTDFDFQCAGPRVLEMLEAATGDDLHDIPFMGFRMSSINDKPVRIMRMGMGGTLSYEVHGNTTDAPELYTKIYEAGKPFGVKKIGWLAYASNHTENGYPQETLHFTSACREDKKLMECLRSLGYPIEIWPGHPKLYGSSGPDIKKRYRNPIELGFGASVTFDHEFPGKAILEKLKANPVGKTVTLVWNPEDILDVQASYYQKKEKPYKFMEYPSGNWLEGLEQDDVFDHDGKLVGYSNNRIYTLYSRDMISLGVIDVKYAKPDSEVKILWGDPGDRQKYIRATVAPFPHLDLTPNSKFDVETIPHIHAK
jgi:glycine cleavage system aminomethyltransferase T